MKQIVRKITISPIRVALIYLLLFLAACGQQETVTPQGTLAVPTSSAANTPTSASLLPTDTPLPAPPTLAPPATATAIPTLAPTATPEGPAGIFLLTAADFGTDRNPLTGELAADPSVLLRRPIAVKLSNAPPTYVRPQSGLNQADIVYEHIAEATITRFTAIFYGQTPPSIGPIRSARLIDLEIPAMYDAALFFSGASTGVNQRLNSVDFANRVMRANELGYYRTGANKPFEHTLYGNPVQFWQGLTNKGLNVRPSFTSYMAFSSTPPPGGSAAANITLDYQWEKVNWQYDAAAGHYLRWSAGVPHLDGNTGEQVRAKNIVVIFANHQEDATICEQITNGVCTWLSLEAQIWGSGRVVIFRDGQMYEGTWTRANRSDMLTFTDASGNPLPLQIGNSWFQMMSVAYNNPLTVLP
ncbi:MAG: DUF3048 domain-containing protein [Anaerolineae bacterium]|nr:DUF3048 domain-containing protein [Anaerolineae bacterium]